jgi:hypothetical protein
MRPSKQKGRAPRGGNRSGRPGVDRELDYLRIDDPRWRTKLGRSALTSSRFGSEAELFLTLVAYTERTRLLSASLDRRLETA